MKTNQQIIKILTFNLHKIQQKRESDYNVCDMKKPY